MKVLDPDTSKQEERLYCYVLTGVNSEALVRKTEEITNNSDAYLKIVLIETDNWNHQLSPWDAPPVFGKEGFGGDGKETLRRILQEVIPSAEGPEYRKNRRVIGGYSLAGLFSLWAFYETGIFEGAISCSGSLWFPGWDKYMQGRNGPKGGKVYLSLGTTEEKTKNQQMQKVGERTRRQLEMLKADSNIREATLEWNPGGHFNDADGRLIRGIRWMQEAMQNKAVP